MVVQARAKKPMNELYPDIKDFTNSDHRFTRFCTRKNISLRRTTHAAQIIAPANASARISKFHAKLLRVHRRGNFQLCDIANMDQTPLPFALDDGKMYNSTGSKKVWSASAADRLRQQCLLMVNVFSQPLYFED